MQIWQHWMELGNQAYFADNWPEALYCYQRAMQDVWPVWLEITLGAAARSGALQRLSEMNYVCRVAA